MDGEEDWRGTSSRPAAATSQTLHCDSSSSSGAVATREDHPFSVQSTVAASSSSTCPFPAAVSAASRARRADVTPALAGAAAADVTTWASSAAAAAAVSNSPVALSLPCAAASLSGAATVPLRAPAAAAPAQGRWTDADGVPSFSTPPAAAAGESAPRPEASPSTKAAFGDSDVPAAAPLGCTRSEAASSLSNRLPVRDASPVPLPSASAASSLCAAAPAGTLPCASATAASELSSAAAARPAAQGASAASAAAAAPARGSEERVRQQQHVMPSVASTSSTSPAAAAGGSRRYRIGVQSSVDPYYALRCLLQRPQPFAPPGYLPGEDVLQRLQDTRVLVVGAGGLGCEILKCLCLSGFRRLTVLDMDTVHVSNLHRQFLFREEHIGQFKAPVAASLLNSKFSHLGVAVESCVCRLEDKDETFYRQFQLVLSGLDSIEARRWLNSMIHSLVERDENGEVDMSTCIPLLDGGTEGLKGQARFIFPFVTSCFECSLDSFPPQKTYPLCTIAETPRLPEHCIEYAMLVQWPKERPGETFNSDAPYHVEWLRAAAQRRAEAFGIRGVTYSLTLGVAKRIIPAVISTNAIVAAMLVEEAVKIATGCLCSTHDFAVAAAAALKEEEAAIAAQRAAAAAAASLGELTPEPTTAAEVMSSLAAETAEVDYPSAREAPTDSPVAHKNSFSPGFPADAAVPTAAAASSLSSSRCCSATAADRAGIPTGSSSEGSQGNTVAASAEEKEVATRDDATAAVASGNSREEKKSVSSLPPLLEGRDTGEAVAADEEDVLSGIQNYIMYVGEAGIYTHTFEYGKKLDCLVCGGRVLTKRVLRPEEETLEDLFNFFAAEPSLRLHKPSISGPRGIIFLQHPPQVRRVYEPNLAKTLRELQREGLLSEKEELAVTDPLLSAPLRLRLLLG